MTQIINNHQIPLPAAAIAVLKKLFADYQRVVIAAEFSGGFGGGHILKVLPINAEGQEEMPTVVKIAPQARIEKEASAYNAHIKNKIEGAAKISEPVAYAESWGGIRYDLAGGGIFEFISFIKFCHEYPVADITHVLERQLFAIMGSRWRKNSFAPAFHLGSSYDGVLPVNLWVQPSSEPAAAALQIDPQTKGTAGLGDRISLSDFYVTEIDQQAGTVTLNCPPTGQDFADAYRIRLQSIQSFVNFEIGQKMAPVTGTVVQTRADYLRQEAAAFLPDSTDLTADTLLLNGEQLPNPILRLKDVLALTPGVNVTSIHGDFNVENILVDPDSRTVRLIDFTDARRDHVLHDLLRLETGIMTRLLPTELAQSNLPPATVLPFFTQLHCATQNGVSKSITTLANGHQHGLNQLEAVAKSFAIIKSIRTVAADLLLNRNDINEYYNGLTIYLLGALKFKNLDEIPHAKEVAFWGAAAAQKLVDDPPACPTPRVWQTCRGRIAITVLLAAVFLFAFFLLRQTGWVDNPARGAEIATVIGLEPEVDIKHADQAQLETAVFGALLYENDVLITYEDAAVIFACENGSLFGAESEATTRITCDPNDERLLTQLEPALINLSEPVVISLVPDGDRGSRGETDSRVQLLAPRNTTILETRPTFRWTEVPGASGYRLSVSLPGGQWSQVTTDTQLPYPATEPPLSSDSVNTVTLVTLDNENIANENAADLTELRVADSATMAAVTAAVADIQQLNLAAETKAYLLAQLYQREKLNSAAITQLEGLVNSGTPVAAAVWQQLGDLYFEAGLYSLAEEQYQMALAAAQTAVNPRAAAAATVGLAEVAYVFDENERTISLLTEAEQLYRDLGDIEQAELIATEKAAIESES